MISWSVESFEGLRGVMFTSNRFTTVYCIALYLLYNTLLWSCLPRGWACNFLIKCLCFFLAPYLNIEFSKTFGLCPDYGLQSRIRNIITLHLFVSLKVSLCWFVVRKKYYSFTEKYSEVVQIRLFYHCDTVSPTIAAWSVRLFLSGSDSSEQMFKKKKKKKHRTVY